MLLALTSFALAANRPDLTTTITLPSTVPYVYANGTYSVKVSNGGNADASNVVVTVTLPRSHTSPGTYVEGTISGLSSGCSLSGVTLTCNVGTVKKGKNTSISFTGAFPENDTALALSATASTTTTESTTLNNLSSATIVLDNYDVVFGTSFNSTVSHCTGTGLTSYLECLQAPGSVASHAQTFNSDGSLSFPAYGPDYGGTWSSDTPDHLVFEITELGTPTVEFEGWGVSASCWEGIATFPSSTSSYVSAYHVCVI